MQFKEEIRMFKHRNKGNGVITIFDSEGKRHTLKKGGVVEIDVARPWNGVVVEETEKTEKAEKKTKKTMESDREW